MDETVRRFRREVSRELGNRVGAERRYSVRLREAAVAYWRARESAGDGLVVAAQVLGVAPGTLRRWAEVPGFEPVQVVPDAMSRAGLTVIVEAECVRVEGLDVDTVAQLLARLG